jgi:hypothetical protein
MQHTEPAVGVASLPAGMRASLVGAWRQGRPAQRFGYLVGGALVLVGLAHLAAWLAVGGAWQGPVSFRKPTTFGLSFGLTTITLAWVTGWLRITDRTRWLLLGPLAAADTYEVAWVTVQHARGVPSHFNDTTPLDERLFILGAVMVAIAILVIAAMTLAAFVRTTAPAPMALAIRAGLVALLAAQVTGMWMLLHGLALLDADADPTISSMSTYGAAGSMKFAHAVPMHAIQVLPALAWLLSFAAMSERRRLALVGAATLGYGALVVVSLLQTAAGLAPLDLGVAAAVLSLLGVALVGGAFGAALVALRHPTPAST